jgi:hypothetical protein
MLCIFIHPAVTFSEDYTPTLFANFDDVVRNHGSHFENQGVAFEEDTGNRTDYDQHAVDKDKEQMSDTRFEDIEKI